MAVLRPAVQNTGSAVNIRVASWRPNRSALHPELQRGRAVAVEHPLGRAGGAGAEDHQGVVVGRDHRRVQARVPAQEPLPRGRAHHGDVTQRGQGADVVLEVPLEEARLGEDDADVGRVDHEGQLGDGRERRERHRHGTGQGRPEDRRHRLGPVAHEDPDRVARAVPSSARPPATRRALVQEVCVRPPHRDADQRVVEHERLVGPEPRRHLLEEPAHGERADARVALEGRALQVVTDVPRRGGTGPRSRGRRWRWRARPRCARRSRAGGAPAAPSG